MIKIKNLDNIDINLLHIFKRYFLKNRFKVYGFILLYVVSINLIELPYFNILFSSVTILLFMALYGAIVLKINGKIYILLSLGLFVIALLFSLFHANKMAELIGNYIYILLVIGSFSLLTEMRKNYGTNNKKNTN